MHEKRVCMEDVQKIPVWAPEHRSVRWNNTQTFDGILSQPQLDAVMVAQLPSSVVCAESG